MLLGRREDVPSLLRAADAFLFCSRTEGLPNALLEAMAAGCVALVTHVPGCRDCVSHNVTGWLMAPGSADAVAEALDRVLPDAALRQRLGGEARAWVRANASLAASQAGWMRLYASLAPPGGVQRVG